MGAPAAIAVDDGVHGERLCLTTAGFYVPGSEVEPRLRLLDPTDGSWVHVAVGPAPVSVRVVSVP
jgi:hypothetical protein